jgi:hypothetical protein
MIHMKREFIKKDGTVAIIRFSFKASDAKPATRAIVCLDNEIQAYPQ